VNVSLFDELTPAVALLFDAGWSDWSEFSQNEIMVRGVDVSFPGHAGRGGRGAQRRGGGRLGA